MFSKKDEGGVVQLLALLSIVLCLAAAATLRAWSLGELVGYVAGAGSSPGRWR